MGKEKKMNESNGTMEHAETQEQKGDSKFKTVHKIIDKCIKVICEIFEWDYSTDEGKEKVRKNIRKSIISLLILCCVGNFLHYAIDDQFGGSGGWSRKKYINMVKTGSPIEYDKVDYNYAFNNNFKKGEWSYVALDGNDRIVQYDGKLMNEAGNKCDVCFQFRVDPDAESFTVSYLGIDGEAQSLYTISNVIDEIFASAYKKKGYDLPAQYSGLEDFYDQMFNGVEEAMVNAYINAANETSPVSEATKQEPETEVFFEEATEKDIMIDPNDLEVIGDIGDTADNNEEEYVISGSDIEDVRMMGDIVMTMEPKWLRIAKNEIFARHGRMFSDPEIQAYFDSKEWYYGYIKPDDFNMNTLTEIEKSNIEFLDMLYKNSIE